MSKIDSFSGEYRWLSNFWLVEVFYEGIAYPSVENAYQAAKFVEPEERKPFTYETPKVAKILGRDANLPLGWNKKKVEVMRELISQKFREGTELAEMLKRTGDVDIVEGNDWGDIFWGVCNGVGRNQLGLLLMEQRAKLGVHSLSQFLKD